LGRLDVGRLDVGRVTSYLGNHNQLEDAMTTKLYEDNAGGLTIECDGMAYSGLEQLEDGSTLVSLSEILTGDVVGDLDCFVSTRPVADEELVATCQAGQVTLVGCPGIAARRLIGRCGPSEAEKDAWEEVYFAG
jgi:hypothetical protein